MKKKYIIVIKYYNMFSFLYKKPNNTSLTNPLIEKQQEKMKKIANDSLQESLKRTIERERKVKNKIKE